MSAESDRDEQGQRLPSIALIVIASLVVTGMIIGAWVWANLSMEQVSFLGMGSSALFGAWLVWRYGIIAFSYTKFGDTAETNIKEAPLPRVLLAPALALAGIALVLAGTPTGLGEALFGPVRATYLLYQFGEQAWGLLLGTLLLGSVIVLLLVSLIRLDGELFAAGIFVSVFFGFFALCIYGLYRWQPDHYRDAWDDYMEPFRFVVGLFT